MHPPRPPLAGGSHLVQASVTVLVALLLSAVFTWPALRPADEALAATGFDGTGMSWMAWYMAEHFLRQFPEHGFFTALSGYPAGEDLQGNDGWLFLVASMLLPGLASPLGLHLWAWLGCAASFLAAERAAVLGWGARWPWSMAAGIVFAFNGVNHGALSEGRFYHLAQWPLALFFLAWKKLLDGARCGAALGLAWLLCLLTSAYTALLASLVAVFTWAWHPRRTQCLGELLVAAVFIIPSAAMFVAIFVQSSRLENWGALTETLRNSATFSGLLGWSPAETALPGFNSPTLGFAGLALALASTRMLRPEIWLPLLSGAILSVFLALGPVTALSPFDDPGIHTPLGWLTWMVPSISFFRFPVRFLLLTHLAVGILAALALSRSRGLGLRVLFLGALLADALFWSGPSLLQPRSSPVPGNSVYSGVARDTPILDIIPEPSRRLDYGLLIVVHRICAAQILHARPLLEYCLAPVTAQSPAFKARRRILDAALNGRAIQAGDMARRMGVGGLVLHPDLFDPTDRAMLRHAFRQLSGTPVGSAEGGEYLELYLLSGR